MEIGDGVVPNLKDNIQQGLDKFKIADFIDAAESNEYLSKLPGVKSLLLALKKGLNFLMDIIDKVLAFIQAILDLINWFIDKIEEFLKHILDIINQFLGLFGLTLELQGSILDALLNGCIELTNENKPKLDFNILDKLIISSIIVMATCANGNVDSKNAFSDLYKNHIENDDNINNIIDTINDIKVTIDNNKIKIEIDELENKIRDNRLKINELMATVDNNYKNLLNEIIGLKNDINNLRDQLSISNINNIMQYNNTIYNEIKIINNSVINNNYSISDNIVTRDILLKIEKEIDDKLALIENKENQLDDILINYINNNESNDNKTLIIGLINDNKILQSKIDQLSHDKILQDLNNKLYLLNIEYNDIINKYNKLYADIGKLVLDGLAKSNSKINKINDMIEDILNTPPGQIIINSDNYYTNKFTKALLNIISNMDDISQDVLLDVDLVKYNNELILTELDNINLDLKITLDELERFLLNIKRLDKFSNILKDGIYELYNYNRVYALLYYKLLLHMNSLNIDLDDTNRVPELTSADLLIFIDCNI